MALTKTKNKLFLLIAVIAIVCASAAAWITFVSTGTLAGTFFALVPPILAITLALITKEVFSSLFLGTVLGAMMLSGFSFTGTVDIVMRDGLMSAISDLAGLLVFFVELGIIVALINKSGGSQAFGRWASAHIKTKTGACLATLLLGMLIFIDDYFNCLTVGSVMRPLTDAKKVSRAKLAYLIDATAAPVCMIAPISSWAAAVASYVDSKAYSGLSLFVHAIPFNFYSILTIVFILTISLMRFDYGRMEEFEIKAENGDIIGDGTKPAEEGPSGEGRPGIVLDLVFPVVVLIACCLAGLLYVGGFFGGSAWSGAQFSGDFIGALGNTDSAVALPWGGIIALVAVVVYFLVRRSLTFAQCMECVPQGFIAMASPIFILILATSLKNMTVLLGAKEFVAGVMSSASESLYSLLPAIIFPVACVLSFSTGTSWGTFGILLPIVTSVFPETSPLLFVGVSACLAGAVCGDHCSPISDTTIISSAGAQCNHLDHVSTQLPYTLTVAALSLVMYVISGFLPNAWIVLPMGIALTVLTLYTIRWRIRKKERERAAAYKRSHPEAFRNAEEKSAARQPAPEEK